MCPEGGSLSMYAMRAVCECLFGFGVGDLYLCTSKSHPTCVSQTWLQLICCSALLLSPLWLLRMTALNGSSADY